MPPFLDLDRPLSRLDYVRAGAALMGLKYVVDAVVIYLAEGVFWTPLDYFLPMVSFPDAKTAEFSWGLNVWLVCWTLPFLALGIVLSVRRAIDAGLSPWLVVAFFAPVLNYVLIIALAVTPARTVRTQQAAPSVDRRWRRSERMSTALGVAAGVASALTAVGLGVLFIRSYGAALFLGTPFIMGAVSAFVANRVTPRERGELMLVGLLTLAASGAALLALAMEGAVCLMMAVPLAVPLAMLGTTVGRVLSRRPEPPTTLLVVITLVAPGGPLVERALHVDALRVVSTSIEVDAPPDRVWRHVVAFSEIDAPPAWYFRFGLAYPLRARIEGTGVGAVRRCEFTTGAFIEPITAWEPPGRLAFDVVEQPPPLQEWSPYGPIYTPHLRNYFRTTRGEFRLTALEGNRTRLEGHTWYSLRMGPARYWTSIADAILHGIHRRVLEHVKAQAEG